MFFRKRKISFFNSKNQEVGFFCVFPRLLLLQSKSLRALPLENLSGDHRKHRGKCENSGFSPVLQMDQFCLKISHKNEKTDRRSGRQRIKKMVDHFFIFQKNSLHLKLANFSSLKRRSIFTSRKILREKLELHSTSKKSLNIAKMVEKRFELPTSTHDLSYEKIRLADCHKIPIFSDKSENPHARVTGVHKFLTFTPPSVPVDNREASHQEMKPL